MAFDSELTPGQIIESTRARVHAPGILLIITGVLNLLFLGLLGYLGQTARTVPKPTLLQFHAEMLKRMANDPRTVKAYNDLVQQMGGPVPLFRLLGKLLLIYGLVGVGAAALSIFGGTKMIGVRSHKLALAGAVAMFVPILGVVPTGMWPLACPCLLGLIVGIWCMVILLSSEVKDGFRLNTMLEEQELGDYESYPPENNY